MTENRSQITEDRKGIRIAGNQEAGYQKSRISGD